MKPMGILLGCFVLLGVAAGAGATERFFEIRASKFVYSPNIIKVETGDTVTLRLISEDVTHGLFIDGYEIKTSAYPGQDGNLTFVADKPGKFSFRCSVTCGEMHPYMIGYLRVGTNARLYGFAGLVVVLAVLSMGSMLLSKGKETDNG